MRPSPNAFAHVGAEIRLGESYAASHGGFLPKDQFWSYEEYRHDLNPRGFDRHHARLAPLLDRNEAVRESWDVLHPVGGLLPDNPYWNYLRYRHDLDPKRFDHYHPRLGKLLDRDEAYRESHRDVIREESISGPAITVPPDHRPPADPVATPEPGASLLMAIGLIALVVGRIWTRGRRLRTGSPIAGRVRSQPGAL